MTRKYFGTDGIRGTVGIHPITPDFALRLAHAVGRVLKQKEARPLVLIGKVISASHNPFADNGIKFFSAAVPSRCCA